MTLDSLKQIFDRDLDKLNQELNSQLDRGQKAPTSVFDSKTGSEFKKQIPNVKVQPIFFGILISLLHSFQTI